MKIVMAGEGAIARKHLAAVSRIDGVEVVSLAGGLAADTEELAGEAGIDHWSLDLDECLARPGVEAAILATPTQLHASQAIQVLGPASTSSSRSRWPTIWPTAMSSWRRPKRPV